MNIRFSFKSNSTTQLVVLYFMLGLSVAAFPNMGPNIFAYLKIPIREAWWLALFVINTLVGLLAFGFLFFSIPTISSSLAGKKIIIKGITIVAHVVMAYLLFRGTRESAYGLLNGKQIMTGECKYFENRGRGSWIDQADISVGDSDIRLDVSNSDAKLIAERATFPEACREKFISVDYIKGYNRGYVTSWRFVGE